MALVKNGPFLWLFMAIKFELSLVITFMAFYDCVRTLQITQFQPTGNRLYVYFGNTIHINEWWLIKCTYQGKGCGVRVSSICVTILLINHIGK